LTLNKKYPNNNMIDEYYAGLDTQQEVCQQQHDQPLKCKTQLSRPIVELNSLDTPIFNESLGIPRDFAFPQGIIPGSNPSHCFLAVFRENSWDHSLGTVSLGDIPATLGKIPTTLGLIPC
jgi:hypothetical protein